MQVAIFALFSASFNAVVHLRKAKPGSAANTGRASEQN